MALTADAIFAAPLASKEVEVPEWGGTVTVRALSGRTKLDLFAILNDNDRAAEEYEVDQTRDEEERVGAPYVERFISAYIEIILACYNEDGDRIFALSDYDRVKNDLSHDLVNALYGAIVDLRPNTSLATLKKTSL